MSIRLKIILLFSLFCLTLSGTLSFYIYFYSAGYRKEVFENSLLVKSKQIAYLYANTSNIDQLEKVLSNADIINLNEEKIYIILEDSTLIYSNTPSDTATNAQLSLLNRYSSLDTQYVYIDSTKFETVITQFKTRKSTHFLLNSAIDYIGHDKINNLKSILILGNAFSFFLSLFLGIIFSDNIIAPLQKIVKEVNNIAGNEFDKRIEVGKGKDELAQLSINFNQMLQRMQEVYVSQKSFISHASHELRTPLANILVNLETTLLYEKDIKTTNKQIKASIEQLKQCIELTNGLLQLAYINKELTIVYEKIRIEELLLEEISLLKNKYKKQQISFEILHLIENDNNPVDVQGNKSLLSTCIKNILENASKYSDQKKVIIQLSKNALDCEIKVIDQGIGIPQADISHLFEPLYRGSNTHKFQGFGIGLSLSYRIILLHKGFLSVFSELGNGSTITLKLPLTID
jgi:signal transduction histidine kinase